MGALKKEAVAAVSGFGTARFRTSARSMLFPAPVGGLRGTFLIIALDAAGAIILMESCFKTVSKGAF